MKRIMGAISELLIECGFNKSISTIKLTDKDCIVNIISLHHLILKVKAELDQLKSGLEILGVAAAMKAHSELFQPLFTNMGRAKLTPGML